MTTETQKSFREMTDIERRTEAKKYTTIALAMSKCGFAQNAYDHLIRGGTVPRREMLDSPEKTEGELMSLEEITKWMEANINLLVMGRQTRQDIENQLQEDLRRRNTRNGLVGSFAYLGIIGKIPERYQYLFK